jgi:phosphoserine phosphatase RsbU/P
VTSVPEKRYAPRLHSHLEEELRLKNEALSVVQDCVAIADARLPNAPLIYVNAAFERVTGYSAAEVAGRPYYFLQGSASDPIARERLRLAIQEQRGCCVELLNYRKEGKTFVSRIAVAPVRGADGWVTHFIITQEDITEHKRMEEALSATAKALQTTFVDIQNVTRSTQALQAAMSPVKNGEFHGGRFVSDVLRCPDSAGDLLNCVPLDERQTGFYLIDIRAHGVPAALDSLRLGRLLFAHPAQSFLYRPLPDTPGKYNVSEPVDVIERLRTDAKVEESLARCLSVLYGVIDADKNEFRFASVGQIGIVLWSAQGEPIVLGPAKFPACLYPEAACEQKVAKLNKGDRLYLCTDGVVDALDECGERLGIEGLVKAINESACHRLDESVASIANLVRNWCGGAGPEDDASMLALEITS